LRATTLALKAALPEGLALRGLPFALRGKVWLSERRAARAEGPARGVDEARALHICITLYLTKA
jgi:hypothetical protein